MEIKIDDLSDPRIEVFLNEHLEDMKAVSPPESKHALDIDGLRMPDVTFWSVWEESQLVGCGALKELSSAQAEIKSMRVAEKYRGKGIASTLLSHMLSAATEKGYRNVSLETGSMAYFEPARQLYQKHGFEYCEPFADYEVDIYSLFMSKALNAD